MEEKIKEMEEGLLDMAKQMAGGEPVKMDFHDNACLMRVEGNVYFGNHNDYRGAQGVGGESGGKCGTAEDDAGDDGASDVSGEGIESAVSGDMEWMVSEAIRRMEAEGAMKYAYDLAWIIKVMMQTKGMPDFPNLSQAYDYIRGLECVARMPVRSGVSQHYSLVHGEFPNWSFYDAPGTQEANRRINVAKRFVSICNSLKRGGGSAGAGRKAVVKDIANG